MDYETSRAAICGLALGDQIAANWLPLLGITYEPKDDLLEIALEGLDHRTGAVPQQTASSTIQLLLPQLAEMEPSLLYGASRFDLAQCHAAYRM
jgi:hypothetical protein